MSRFTTQDSINDGKNWYAFATNNPINFIDPFGLSASDNQQSNQSQGFWGDLLKSATDAFNKLMQNPKIRFGVGLGLNIAGHLLEKGSKALGVACLL